DLLLTDGAVRGERELGRGGRKGGLAVRFRGRAAPNGRADRPDRRGSKSLLSAAEPDQHLRLPLPVSQESLFAPPAQRLRPPRRIPGPERVARLPSRDPRRARKAELKRASWRYLDVSSFRPDGSRWSTASLSSFPSTVRGRRRSSPFSPSMRRRRQLSCRATKSIPFGSGGKAFWSSA